MANVITANGIEIDKITDITEKLKDGMVDIFGDGVSFEQDSPDGQLLNIFAQALSDSLEHAVDIYNSFDPDIAVGTTLDSRCAYNGVVRKAGSYTIVPIDITVKANKTVTLAGLREQTKPSNAFTVSDNSGNVFYLISTATISASATNTTVTLNFRAEKIGSVNAVINTITNIVTPIQNVLSVNNSQTEIVIGTDVESDESLRLRRQQAVGYSIAGSVEVLQASLRDLEGVTDVAVYENRTSETDDDGIPSHSVWIIVEGGDNSKIGACIYLRLNAGCGMKGNTTVGIETIYGNVQSILFDRPITQALSITFSITREKAGYVFDETHIKKQLAERLDLKLNNTVTITDVQATLKSIDDNLVYYDIVLSSGGVTSNTMIQPPTKQYKFTLSVDDITILD